VKTSLVLFSAVTYHILKEAQSQQNSVSITTTSITTTLTTSFDYKQSLSDKSFQHTCKWKVTYHADFPYMEYV